MIPGEGPWEAVESSVHQQAKHSSVGNGQGGVEGPCNLHRKMWYSKVGKQLSDKDIVSEEGDGLGKDGIVVVESQGDDPGIEDRVSQDIDEEDLLLGNREAEEVDRDLVGGGVQD